MATATAQLRFLRMAPRKVRLIVDVLRGQSVAHAEAQLIMQSRRAAEPLLKLLRSCIANATNLKLQPERMYISKITVDQGPMLKRSLPRAMGRATPIQKKMSHVTIVLEEGTSVVSRYALPIKKKKSSDAPSPSKRKASTKKTVGDPTKPSATKEQGNPGFFKRIFNRKSV